jgi:hypothetical protein
MALRSPTSVSCRRWWLVAWITVACCCANAGSRTKASQYKFINIVDTTMSLNAAGQALPLAVFSPPSINSDGTVAFRVRTALVMQFPFRIDAVLSSDGGALIPIKLGTFGEQLGFYTDINDTGTVTFSNIGDLNASFIFTGDGGPITTIAEADYNPFSDLRYGPAINESGTVVFAPLLDAGGGAIVASSGGMPSTVVDSSGPFASFSDIPNINDSGVVAFSATLDSGDAGVFSIDSGSITTIADTRGPFNSVRGSSINNAGAVAFTGQLDNGVRGIFVGDGGLPTTVVDDTGPFQTFSDLVSINDTGDVAFRAALDGGGGGIFTGPDPLVDKVIAAGDPVFGSVLTGIEETLGTRAVNNRGDIVFRYTLANGVRGVALAQAVPEPTTFILLLVVGAVSFVSRR